MEVQETEITLFTCKECFIYLIPPGTSFGHRAEMWGLDKPKETVQVKVVRTLDDELCVKLLDKESGALFAECPVPKGQPYTTVLEPVVDSSRYFVARLVDRDDPKRHAFVGMGFRERSVSNSFVTALSEHVHYLRRQEEAAQLREQREEEPTVAPDGQPPDGQFTMQPGQRVHVNLKVASGSQDGSGRGLLSRYAGPVLAGSGAGGLVAPPKPIPKPPSMRQREPAAAEGREKEEGQMEVEADGVAASEQLELQQQRRVSGEAAAEDSNAVPPPADTNEEPDDWGDFVEGT